MPPPGYRCNICHKSDHYLAKCPGDGKRKIDALTPYQGNKMCFGRFKCPKCKRKWISSSSWANHGQDCVKCHITVMPHKQWPIEKQNDVPEYPQFHPEHLCERCKRLGHSCRMLETNNSMKQM